MRRSEGCEGRFSIWPVPAGKYSFGRYRLGECQLVVKSWNRGRSAVRAFSFQGRRAVCYRADGQPTF